MFSGLLIWRKTWLIDVYNSQSAVMAFVVFHGLLGIIMLMGIMFHTFEHGFHPAFYPVEMKAFLPKEETPNFHGDPDEHETTGIEKLRRKASWRWVTNLVGVATIIGIISVTLGSATYGGYPVPSQLQFNEGGLLRTIGINIGFLVLFLGLFLSMYGNVLRARYRQQKREERKQSTTAADGGQPDDAETSED
jgi:hypothetical protein